MKRKYLTTLFALTLLAVMAAGVAYWEKYKGSAETKTEVQEKLLTVDSARVRKLAIKSREGEAVALQREGSLWMISEPRNIPADAGAVSSLLDTLVGAKVEQVVDPNPANLKDYGLDAPGTIVEIGVDAQPEKLVVHIGDETPTGGGIYAQVVGNPRVITLGSYLKYSLNKKLFDLRDKRVLTLATDQIQRVEVDAKEKRYILAKDPQGTWELVLPPTVRTARYTVENMIDRLGNTSMQSIVAENRKQASQYGFATPSLTIKVSGPAGNQTLVFGKKDKDNDRYFAMNPALDPVFTLGSDFFNQFAKDPAELREKDLFSFSSYEVKRVEIDTPKGRRVLEQQKDKWKQTIPAAKDLTNPKVETLLNRLRDLAAVSFPKEHPEDLAAFGLEKPTHKFQVVFGDKNNTEVVEAAKVGDRVYARRSTDLVACEVGKTALEDIEKALDEL